jgi:hypothetical protein
MGAASACRFECKAQSKPAQFFHPLEHNTASGKSGIFGILWRQSPRNFVSVYKL